MEKSQRRRVAFISSFSPRNCGIATFCNDVITNTKLAGGKSFEPLVVAMQNNETLDYNDPVKFEIRRNVKSDYISAADYLNFSHVDAISIQHEFGLYGGEGGSYINLFLDHVTAPVITTMHTVLDKPNKHYYKSTIAICEASHKIIVMNKRGIDMLRNIYGISTNKIDLLPHGIPDLPFVDSSYYKHKFGMTGRKTILTFGLLGRNKGVENMIKALPAIVEADPTAMYIILGRTHPEVIKHEGEAYRLELQRLVKDLGMQKHVIFHNRFVSNEELHNFLCAADIYATPYLHEEQLTSGTLAFAVGTGKAVVSTPYWAAQELLDDQRGKLVRFDDPGDMAKAIVEIIKDENLFQSLRHQAYDYGRNIIWPTIGEGYWKHFTSPTLPVLQPTKARPQIDDSLTTHEVPEPLLDHFQRMTDSTGMYQHAKFTIPDRNHGYCTDDNSRALIAMTKYYKEYDDPEALRLLEIYLSFVCHAQRPGGTVHNFMTFDRKWIEPEPQHDSLGRSLWALGTVMTSPPSPTYLSIIKDLFDNSVQHVPTLSLRGMAYSILGMADYLKQFPGASEIKRHLTHASKRLLQALLDNTDEDWLWFEHLISYDNAVLPHALMLAGEILEDEELIDAGLKTCKFLLKHTYNGSHFSFVGCKGWMEKGGKKAQFDQQPLEAVSTILMLQQAFIATQNKKYAKLQIKAFDWYLGANDIKTPIFDFKSRGCYDGLERNGVNLNQGAESLVSFMISLLSVLDSHNTNFKNLQKDLFPLEVKEYSNQSLLDRPERFRSNQNFDMEQV